MLRWLKSAKQNADLPKPKPGSFLPDPSVAGLSREQAIRRAVVNKAVETVVQPSRGEKRKRGAENGYATYSDKERVEIARYATQHGNSSAARHFTKKLGKSISESTVRGWVKKYKQQLQSTPNPEDITELPMAKRGRPLLLGHELDQQVIDHIKAMRECGGIVNRSILLATATGIVSHHDRSLLAEHGGPIELGRGWANSMMARMGFVKRKGTKAAKHLPDNFQELKDDFLERITSKVSEHKIPPEMIVNIDQTGISIVPVSDWTMELEGSRQVPITGLDDKRQITAVMGVASTGRLIAPQLIYQGKSDACHPKYKFPKDWDITHTETHWSTAETTIRYIENILVPYFDEVRESMDLPLRQQALCILDVYRAHRVEEVLDLFKKHCINVVFVPACCTSELQPLDVSGNAPFKDALKAKFTSWYAQQVTAGLSSGKQVKDIKINLQLSTLKPLHASWLLHAFDQTARGKEILEIGWRKTGIQQAIADAE